jgi:TRAP-type mannitol/chloroaromatic compound transport system permease small subunit
MISVLAHIVRGIDWLNERIGRTAAWLMLAMVITTALVVVLRYALLGLIEPMQEIPVFADSLLLDGMVWLRENYVKFQEAYVWMHGTSFMVAAGYTLLHDGHVRVDIFYRAASPRYKAWVDLLGTLLLLMPILFVIGYYCWPYVVDSWVKHEASREAGGLPAIYLLKSMLLAFVVLTALQGLSLALRSVLVLLNHPEFLPPEEAHEGI